MQNDLEGFAPNAAIAQLAAHRSHNLGIVNSTHVRRKFKQDFLGWQRGCCEAAAAKGFNRAAKQVQRPSL